MTSIYDRNNLEHCQNEIDRLTEVLRQRDLELAKKQGEVETLAKLFSQVVRHPKDEPKPRAPQPLKVFGSAPEK